MRDLEFPKAFVEEIGVFQVNVNILMLTTTGLVECSRFPWYLLSPLFSIFNTTLQYLDKVFANSVMAWRNQGITGSNNIPLGSRRRFGGDPAASPENGAQNGIHEEGGYKRGRSPERGEFLSDQS